MTDQSNWHVKGGFPTAYHLVDDLQKLFFCIFNNCNLLLSDENFITEKYTHHTQFKIVKAFWRQYATVIAE